MKVRESRSTMKLKFEWDRAKAEANGRKHGVSFEVAKEVLRIRLPFFVWTNAQIPAKSDL